MSAFLNALRNPSITNEPPTLAEQRRNDIYVIGLIIVAVLLGWLIRNNTVNAVEEVTFENGIAALAVPANWIISRGDEVLLTAVDPTSDSTFNARVEVFARPLREGEDLNLVSISWPLQRSRDLDRFRTLNSVAVAGPNEEPALLLTYAYIADPTRESGALGMPVVVRGQDLLYLVGEGNERQLIVVSTAADATKWEVAAPTFQRIHNHLGVEVQE